ncbi:hypothetical protein HS088_TW11G00851 [Tripterygium wilfordii]|uniref:Uncharacterized protein n=1 Tax=Tripterygium wilfordii TaxID=458696 RepID=A0A7J7D372_TRIWF|nr:hypothetical protein HS088_TW11G00851 [Tripterygium wilfordii]
MSFIVSAKRNFRFVIQEHVLDYVFSSPRIWFSRRYCFGVWPKRFWRWLGCCPEYLRGGHCVPRLRLGQLTTDSVMGLPKSVPGKLLKTGNTDGGRSSSEEKVAIDTG